jgi:hypothetical protein
LLISAIASGPTTPKNTHWHALACRKPRSVNRPGHLESKDLARGDGAGMTAPTLGLVLDWETESWDRRMATKMRACSETARNLTLTQLTYH